MKLLFHFLTVIVGKDVTVPFYISAGMGLHMPLVFNISHLSRCVFITCESLYRSDKERLYSLPRSCELCSISFKIITMSATVRRNNGHHDNGSYQVARLNLGVSILPFCLDTSTMGKVVLVY